MAAPNTEIITIDNFASVLSKIDPNGSPLFALVDMGSNGIRFSISNLSPKDSRLLRCIYKERAGISLYDALNSPAPGTEPLNFSPSIISTVSSTLSRFHSICAQYQVPPSQIAVFATEAMRTAHNQAAMLTSIDNASTLNVSILSPQMESMFGALGARSGFSSVNGLFMDLGGGSVQMTYLNSRDPDYALHAAQAATSMPYGAAKLTAAMTTSASTQAAEADLQTLMATSFRNLLARFPSLAAQFSSPKGLHIYFCGGGFRGYGNMLMHTHAIQPYPIPAIGGFSAPGATFSDVQAMLRANSAKGKVFGMSKRRREQFPAIAMVVQTLVAAVGGRIGEVTFCAGGNREGVLFAKLPEEVRESDPVARFPGEQTAGTELRKLFDAALPAECPEVFAPALRAYFLGATWKDLGDGDDANSQRALHEPISGAIAGLPGLTHEVAGVVALTMCERWGVDLGPVDALLYENLEKLVGETLCFWCAYVGALLRLLARIWVLSPTDQEVLGRGVSFEAVKSNSLGKSGKKSGVRLVIGVRKGEAVDVEGWVDLFKNVGKGSSLKMDVTVKEV